MKRWVEGIYLSASDCERERTTIQAERITHDGARSLAWLACQTVI